jgi:hypothetical protein
MMERLEGVRPIGRPKKRWMDGCMDGRMDAVQTDVKILLKVTNWKARELDRNEWKHISGKSKARFGL